MNKPAILLLTLAIGLLSPAASRVPVEKMTGQSPTARLACDSCINYPGEFGWEVRCEILLLNGGAIRLMPGTEPAWSPDGLRIAAVDGDRDLLLYNFANGTTVELTGAAPADGPRWSPDNTRIAFASYRDGQRDLYVINADGSALTRLTDAGVGGGFAWSPGGMAIAFGAAVGGVLELFVMLPDGSNKTRLTYNVGFEATTPSWSSDGSRIAFDCANDICSINADGTNFTQLTTDPGRASGAVLSPVDDRIAFVTGRFGRSEVVIMDGGGAVTRVAPGLLVSEFSWSALQYSWSPDGERLALVNLRPQSACDADGSCYPPANDVLYTVGTDGNGLTQGGGGLHHPRWAPSLPGQPVAIFTYNCVGAACQFDATGSSDADGILASYVWDFGDGTTGTGATVDHQYATGATYRVKLIVTDHGGAMGIALRNVTANAPPVPSFTVTCNGPTCTFDASASSDPDGLIGGYGWHFGDGSSLGSQSATVTHTYASGTFVARLFIYDNGGQGASAEVTLTIVNAVPVADFTVACVLLTCTFDASASSDADGPIVYRWAFGDNREASDKIVTHTYGAGGTYLARLTITDSAGQTATTTRTVNVIAPQVHVGNLDGSRTTLRNTWNASVTIEVHREDHQGLGGATVSVIWSDGITAACATDPSGRCVLSRNGLPNMTSEVTLTVFQVVHGTRPYQAGLNHDPDDSSNGTSITVRRR